MVIYKLLTDEEHDILIDAIKMFNDLLNDTVDEQIKEYLENGDYQRISFTATTLVSMKSVMKKFGVKEDKNGYAEQ